MGNDDEHDADLVLVSSYSREVKIACDELYDDPFDGAARRRLVGIIEQHSRSAEAAHNRLALRSARSA